MSNGCIYIALLSKVSPECLFLAYDVQRCNNESHQNILVLLHLFIVFSCANTSFQVQSFINTDASEKLQFHSTIFVTFWFTVPLNWLWQFGSVSESCTKNYVLRSSHKKNMFPPLHGGEISFSPQIQPKMIKNCVFGMCFRQVRQKPISLIFVLLKMFLLKASHMKNTSRQKFSHQIQCRIKTFSWASCLHCCITII